MNFRALLRRAFPYIVIGIGGFALAYVVTFVFVLPAKILPPAPHPSVPDSSQILRPIDTGVAQRITPPMEPPQVNARIVESAPDDTVPIVTPDLVGMSLPDARGVLNRLRLRVAVTHDTSSFQPPNTVLRQSPVPDSPIMIRGTVTLTVSYFPRDSTPDTMRLPHGTPASGVKPATDTFARLDTFSRPDTIHQE